MKKSSSSKKIFSFLLVVLTISALGTSYVAMKKKCDDLKGQKEIESKKLKDQDNRELNLYAIYQRLTSEDRIVNIAESELRMIIADPPVLIVKIEQEKIEHLQSLLTVNHE